MCRTEWSFCKSYFTKLSESNHSTFILIKSFHSFEFISERQNHLFFLSEFSLEKVEKADIIKNLQELLLQNQIALDNNFRV